MKQPAQVTIGPFTLLPMNLAALALLQSANSPFLTGEQPRAESIILDFAAAVYILSTPDRTVYAEVIADTIMERVWETAASIPAMSAEELGATFAKLAQHIHGRPFEV